MKLAAKNLVIERGGRIVVDGASFVASSGEALLLTGANGAGKTTLLRAIAGYLPLSGGAIQLDGGDPEKTVGEQAHSVGHANAVKSNLSVRENVTFWAEFLGSQDSVHDRVNVALSAFAIADLAEFPASYLSAGQKRRLGLARTLAAPRSIWLLDEPTVSLDAASTALLAKAVNDHTRGGGIAIAATHLPLGLERTRELHLGGGGASS